MIPAILEIMITDYETTRSNAKQTLQKKNIRREIKPQKNKRENGSLNTKIRKMQTTKNQRQHISNNTI